MDIKKFTEKIPNLDQNWGEALVEPISSEFAEILSQIQGETTAKIMQLLNCAVECLESDEIYGEIGCQEGLTLIGALLNNPEQMAYAVDNLAEDKFQQLVHNLEQFNLAEQVFFCNQEYAEFFADLKELQPDLKIGVYFYNGKSDYRSVLLGLLLVRPFLADQALMMINNSNYTMVEQAIYDFINQQDACNLLINLPLNCGNGITILNWNVNQSINYSWQEIVNQYRNYVAIKAISDLHCQLELEAKPQVINSLITEALELNNQGKFEEAIKKFKEVLNWSSSNPYIYNNIASIYFKQEQYQEALRFAKISVNLDSSIWLHQFNLGKILEKLGEINKAIEAYRLTIQLNPEHLLSYFKLGQLLFNINQLDQSKLIYENITKIDKNNLEAYLQLGDILLKTKQYESAIENYQKALILKPKTPEILQKIAIAYDQKNDLPQALLYYAYVDYRQEKYEEAIQKFEEFFKDQQGEGFDYAAWADCYHKLNLGKEAREIYIKGLQSNSNHEYLYLSFLSFLPFYGYTEEDFNIIDQYAKNNPDNLIINIEAKRLLPVLYNTKKEVTYYRNRFKNFINYLDDLVKSGKLNDPQNLDYALANLAFRTNFYLQYQYQDDKELQSKYGSFVHYVMGMKYPQWIKPLKMPPLTSENKIKVGYISNLLHFHTVSKLFKGWLKHHNSEQFEIYCYYGDNKNDLMIQEIKNYSHKFYQIPEGNVEKTCQQIYEDHLDILVFFDVGMVAQMTQIAALRLAPIQCLSWGHPITSGIPNIDYFLSSELMEPKNGQDHYTETLVKLPNISISYGKTQLPQERKKRLDFALKEDDIVYLSCQSLFKYLPQFDYILPKIAQSVSHAKFVFINRYILSENSSDYPFESYNVITQKFYNRLAKAFAKYGLNSRDFCVFSPPLNTTDYLNLNLLSDVYLDTLAWSGGNTTLEALACNLPVVTCPGEFMRSRHSYGILKMLGVEETIANNEQEYIDIAVKLGLDHEWRNQIRQKIETNHDRLYDDLECVKGLEEFYQKVVREYPNFSD